MEYERIEKVQTGIISPSKLRMKLMGTRKKDGSNSNSSRASPSKLEDSEFVKNSLLKSDFDEDATTVVVSSVNVTGESSGFDQTSCQSKLTVIKENESTGRVRMQHLPRAEGSNSSVIHPIRTVDDGNLDYDSNASSSSFEFHRAERSGHHHVARSYSRPMPSKWNDAEKWIMNKQSLQNKKNVLQNQTNRLPGLNNIRVAPEHTGYDNKSNTNRIADTKRVDFCQPMQQMGMGAERFSFVPSSVTPSGPAYGANVSIDTSLQSKDLKEVFVTDSSCTKSMPEESTGIPAIREVSMRDMGTEMTPVASQEPSRTSTPIGATTPLRSPSSSIPSTPRRAAPAPTPFDNTTDEESQNPVEFTKRELSEEELKLKTRREIVALGMQLGKMNIAAWASKEEQNIKGDSNETVDVEQLERFEFEKCASAWEEVENSKHIARHKREEIKIQAWESQQKAKLEAEMRKIEAQVEQMKAGAQAKMVKKIALARQRSEEKRAAAEARRNRDAERTAAQAEYIRQTGRMPSSNHICCGWF